MPKIELFFIKSKNRQHWLGLR